MAKTTARCHTDGAAYLSVYLCCHAQSSWFHHKLVALKLVSYSICNVLSQGIHAFASCCSRKTGSEFLAVVKFFYFLLCAFLAFKKGLTQIAVDQTLGSLHKILERPPFGSGLSSFPLPKNTWATRSTCGCLWRLIH